jgi:hypothetical protein
MALRPFPLPPPHPRDRNSDDKITAGLGRNRFGAGGVEWCRMAHQPPKPFTPSGDKTLAPLLGSSFLHQRIGHDDRTGPDHDLRPKADFRAERRAYWLPNETCTTPVGRFSIELVSTLRG